jgi:aspartyl-tRNA(Asn)/glutamyl-tRNA(Gln) amidotransferase subunit B
MPGRKADRFRRQYGLTLEEALAMSAERDLSEYFEAVVNQQVAPRTATHWMATQLLPAMRERNQSFTDTPVTPVRFAGLLALLERDAINANAARDVLVHLFESDRMPETLVEQYGYRQVSNTDQLEGIVDQVLAANPDAVNDYRNGVAKAMGFLVGQAMQASKGKANPKLIREILTGKL